MKKTIAFLLIILTVLTLCCSCESDKTNIVEVESAEEIAAKIGGTFTLPSTAKYVTYSIIEDSVGQARFTFNSYVFIYRSSKIKASDSLHEQGDGYTGTSTVTIDTRAEVKVYSYPEGGRVAVWNYNGTNYTLYSEKNPTDDVFTELCDLLIR